MGLLKNLLNLYEKLIRLLPYRFARIFIMNFKHIYRHEREFIKNFLNNIDKNRVLVAEANDFHNETLPSYLKYLYEAGLSADILVTHKAFNNNVFFNIDKKYYHNLYRARSNVIYKILNSPEIKKYKHVFIGSNYIAAINKHCTKTKNLHDNKVIIVEHNLKFLTPKITEKHKIACLNALNHDEVKNNVINPHYFGDIKITPKNNKTNFITVGRIEKKRQNYQIIYKTMRELLDENITDFSTALAGVAKDKIDSYLLGKNLRYIHAPKFCEMYELMEQADFILMTLDLNGKLYDHYLKNATSGQIQLSYGFLKPVIINKKFAPAFGFNETNAVLYNDANDLKNAMKYAIEMDCKTYETMQENIKKLRDEISKKSYDNLLNLLNM